jgi:hypothetical protein
MLFLSKVTSLQNPVPNVMLCHVLIRGSLSQEMKNKSHHSSFPNIEIALRI